jgi:hypothetical protein
MKNMKRFPHEFEHRGYRIRKTSFSWRVRGDGIDEIVETIQEGKDLIDKYLRENAVRDISKKIDAIDPDLFMELMKCETRKE